MKTVKIKGKDYVEVKERVRYLSTEYDFPYEINTTYEYFEKARTFIVRATLILHTDKGVFKYTGHAQETISDKPGQVNFASALENCETSAVGRACAFAGIGLVDTIRSMDEMTKAENAEKGVAMTKLQKDEIWKLLETALIEESTRESIIENMSDWTKKRAVEAINFLNMHQGNEVRDLGSSKMGHIRNAVKKALK